MMLMRNWLKGLRTLAGVGTLLAGGAAIAQDAAPSPFSFDVNQSFRQTSYTTGPECTAPSGPAAGAPGCGSGAAGCGADAAGCDTTCSFCDMIGLGGELGDPWKLSSAINGDNEPLFDVGGWTQFGYTNKSDGIFNTHPHHLDLQQLNLYVEKVADGSEGIGFGGRVDLMYGTDAQNTQSFGNNPGRFDFGNSGWNHGVYGWAMPQLYGEVAYDKLSVKIGHFYTLLGYQVVPATGNFFYSIPFTFNFGEAFTHTGALATYKASDDVTLYGGWTLGWDTGFDRFNNGSSFLGGATVKATDSLTVTYITTIGNLGWIGEGYSHAFVADWVINDKWEYVFQSDLIGVDSIGGGHYDTVGINQYLYYTVCEKLKLGSRAEWWKADGSSYYEYTVGANIMPTANLRIRPEIRHQWSPGRTDANAIFGIPLNQTIFGIDAIVTF